MGRGRDFQHAQVQAFENLQQAVEGRRLHGHGVAGAGDRTQGQVDRFGGTVGDHDPLGGQVGLAGQCPPGQDVAQCAVAAGRARGAEQAGVVAQRLDHVVLQGLERIELRRAVGAGEVDLDRRALAGLEHRGDLFMNADIDAGIQRWRQGNRGGPGQGVGLANVVARARSGFQHAVVFQFPAHLHGGRQADGVFFHHQPDRGQAFAGFQGAAADRVQVVVGQLTVQGGRVHDDLGSCTTEVWAGK